MDAKQPMEPDYDLGANDSPVERLCNAVDAMLDPAWHDQSPGSMTVCAIEDTAARNLPLVRAMFAPGGAVARLAEAAAAQLDMDRAIEYHKTWETSDQPNHVAYRNLKAALAEVRNLLHPKE